MRGSRERWSVGAAVTSMPVTPAAVSDVGEFVREPGDVERSGRDHLDGHRVGGRAHLVLVRVGVVGEHGPDDDRVDLAVTEADRFVAATLQGGALVTDAGDRRLRCHGVVEPVPDEGLAGVHQVRDEDVVAGCADRYMLVVFVDEFDVGDVAGEREYVVAGHGRTVEPFGRAEGIGR